MTYSVINGVVAAPPAAGHRICFLRLDRAESVELPELYEQAGRVAARLRGLGVGPGDRIGILAKNGLEWVLLDLAALRLKAVTAGLEARKFESAGDLLARYHLKLLFTDSGRTGQGMRPVAEVREFAGQPHRGKLPAVSYAPDDITTLQFTSGSTGPPKAMTPSVASSDATLRNVQRMFGHTDGDSLFCFLPLSLLQQRLWIYSALYFGHDVTVSMYETAFAALPRARPTVVMGVPAFYQAAKKHIEAQAARRGEEAAAIARRFFGDRVRYLWTGSAPAGGDMLRFFDSCGLAIYEGYGLNEAGIVSKNYPGACKLGSVGRPFPDKHLTFDADGIISVRSDYPIASRYEYAGPGDSAQVFAGPGLVRSGDLGYLDSDGFLFIRGRADDVIVLGNGRKVIVRPLEDYLKASPAIEECVVFCPTQTYLVAVVSPARQPPDEAGIAGRLDQCNTAFGPDEQIRRVVIARTRFSLGDHLVTSQFKPRRRQIFEAYRAEIMGRKAQSGEH